MDTLRQFQGGTLAAWGFGPSECPYRVIATGSHWRLRDYGEQGVGASLFIVAAPIKRPYIWDLSPSASAIRHCLQEGLHVYLLEWTPATKATSNIGLEECVAAIAECVAKISTQGSKPFVIGHSLGGTLAAIYGASASKSINGLVLLSAPLCFPSNQYPFRDALIALVPSDLPDTDPFPGSLLSQMSAMASPDTFIWSRMFDALMNAADPRAIDIHARVERWALDEVPLPGKLVHQIIEWLYRQNRFCRGRLKIGNGFADLHRMALPTLAVANMIDDVAPIDSVRPFMEAISPKNAHIIEYQGEPGVSLQHLGILIGREAHAQIWPEMISWINLRA
jgi:polyhydroxyalkanoate synthase